MAAPCPLDYLQFNCQALSTAVQTLPYWTLCIHPSSVILVFCSSIPKSLQTGKRTSSIFLISSLECSSAPLPTPNPTGHSRLILGFTPSRSQVALLHADLGVFSGLPRHLCWSLLKLITVCLPLLFSMLGWKRRVSRSRVVATSLAVGHNSSNPQEETSRSSRAPSSSWLLVPFWVWIPKSPVLRKLQDVAIWWWGEEERHVVLPILCLDSWKGPDND